MHLTQNPPGEVIVTPSDILRHAALYVQRHGWTQTNYYAYLPGEIDTTNPLNSGIPAVTPPADVIGAIGMAVHGRALDNPQATTEPAWPAFHAAYSALSDYLGLVSDTWDNTPDESLGEWNDRQQHASDIIAALTGAADRWDTRHSGDAR